MAPKRGIATFCNRRFKGRADFRPRLVQELRLQAGSSSNLTASGGRAVSPWQLS